MVMKELRQEKRWSQEQLAELSGLSLRTIQRIESGGRAGFDTLVALAATFEIEVVALEQELAMAKSSSRWKNRPAWVRGLFLGSGCVQMSKLQHEKVEVAAAVAGTIFVVIGLFGTSGNIAPVSAKVPVLVCASVMYLAAYLMSVIARVGDQYSVWPWIDPGHDCGRRLND